MFCVLEKDLKTFEYFKRYTDCFEDMKGCIDIDNRIQAEEMEEHLKSHGYESSNTQEKLAWVANNGKPFREYLNTIKLVYVLCKAEGLNPKTLSLDHFTQLEERLNSLKHCLASIF